MCLQMPMHSQCTEYAAMCAADSSLYLCTPAVMTALRSPSAPSSPPPPANTTASSPPPAIANNTGSGCISTPGLATCASYVYPDALAQSGECIQFCQRCSCHACLSTFVTAYQSSKLHVQLSAFAGLQDVALGQDLS